MKLAACVTVLMALIATPVTAASCNASSGAQRVALLELYPWNPTRKSGYIANKPAPPFF